MTELIFPLLNVLLFAYLVYRMRGSSNGDDSQTVSNNLPAWAAQQLEELKNRIQQLENALDESRKTQQDVLLNSATEKATLESALEAAKDKLIHLEKLHEAQKLEEEKAKEGMKNEFKVLAQTILDEKSKQFKTTNSEELDKLLAPFKQKLEDFEKTVKDNHEKEVKSTSALMENIKSLKDMNDKLSEEASGLAKALRGDNKKQGNWGEFVLERALEMSGLAKDKEYFVQNSETTEDGRRLQPDVIIQLPGNKKIIIDSKVSLVAWDNYINAATEEEASAGLKALAVSVQTHIKGLSDKDYPQLYGGDTPEFVLLFIPIEAAFMEVTKFDQALYEFAFSRKIIVVSTSTLLATLKTIAMAWRQEKQTKNVIEIAEAGGKLYDKFVGLSEDLKKLGSQFQTAQNTYQDTMTKMMEGRGNLISQVERLKKLGSKTKKELDNRLVDRAELGEYSDQQIEDTTSEN
ncbi:MAG: DNA recombination protein RmuC [Cryomorphaceae bacterium]|nr:DNA recombination protein RmuC [Cryomorphaceae bacterium]MDC3346588.1 DNA recombination protein RmuC [Schleiferiaceae bacterium]